jgi:hypothetical protein
MIAGCCKNFIFALHLIQFGREAHAALIRFVSGGFFTVKLEEWRSVAIFEQKYNEWLQENIYPRGKSQKTRIA